MQLTHPIALAFWQRLVQAPAAWFQTREAQVLIDRMIDAVCEQCGQVEGDVFAANVIIIAVVPTPGAERIADELAQARR